MPGREAFIIGNQAEQIVLRHMQKYGWFCLRMLMSGYYARLPYPDIICTKPLVVFIEVKTSVKSRYVTIRKTDIVKLSRVCKGGGDICLFALVYPHDNAICFCTLEAIEAIGINKTAKLSFDRARRYCSCARV